MKQTRAALRVSIVVVIITVTAIRGHFHNSGCSNLWDWVYFQCKTTVSNQPNVNVQLFSNIRLKGINYFNGSTLLSQYLIQLHLLILVWYLILNQCVPINNTDLRRRWSRSDSESSVLHSQYRWESLQCCHLPPKAVSWIIGLVSLSSCTRFVIFGWNSLIHPAHTQLLLLIVSPCSCLVQYIFR